MGESGVRPAYMLSPFREIPNTLSTLIQALSNKLGDRPSWLVQFLFFKISRMESNVTI